MHLLCLASFTPYHVFWAHPCGGVSQYPIPRGPPFAHLLVQMFFRGNSQKKGGRGSYVRAPPALPNVSVDTERVVAQHGGRYLVLANVSCGLTLGIKTR